MTPFRVMYLSGHNYVVLGSRMKNRRDRPKMRIVHAFHSSVAILEKACDHVVCLVLGDAADHIPEMILRAVMYLRPYTISREPTQQNRY